VRCAKNLLRPAQVAFGKVEAGENLINRRWRLREGKERTDYFGRVNRVWKTSEPNDDYTEPAGPVDPHLYFVAPLSYAGRVQILARAAEPAKAPLQVVRIGDICIGTTPCETYTEVGQTFQQGSPFAHTFMVELNHAYLGYLPTRRHFELGGYSTWPGANCLEAQASEEIVDHLLEMAREIKPGTH
jgi:hypothetical protein